MNPRLMVLGIVALLVAMLGLSSVYIVSETERAIKLKFGEIVEDDIQPGIHFKWPTNFVHKIKKFDARLLTLDARPERFLTAGKKFLVVDSFVKWRIINVQTYLTKYVVGIPIALPEVARVLRYRRATTSDRLASY